ncbi:MAG: OmpH family outer membrane protein [Candidatus Omnitrophota bacterium]
MKIKILLLITVVVALIMPNIALAEIKIGYVDTIAVFDEYNKTKDQDKVLKTETDKRKDKRETIVKDIRNIKDELDISSDDAKEKKQLEIDKKLRELQEYDNETKLDLGQKRDDMMRDILKEISAVVEEYAKKNSYTMVLNSRVLIYSDEKDDLTQAILDALNAKYKK